MIRRCVIISLQTSTKKLIFINIKGEKKGEKRMLTPFGKELRIFRMERGELLKDMAEKLSVSPAYLSAIENGKKDPTDELMRRIEDAYEIGKDEKEQLEEAKAKTLKLVKLHFSNEEEEEVGLLFARKFDSLSQEQRQGIIEILNKKK